MTGVEVIVVAEILKATISFCAFMWVCKSIFVAAIKRMKQQNEENG